jgi:hypothetical protein
MKKKYDPMSEYADVIFWALKVGLKDLFELGRIQSLAILKTAKHFKKTYGEVKSLFAGTQFEYPESETPMVKFFYECLRTIRDSHL